jgi:hypothetical protein
VPDVRLRGADPERGALTAVPEHASQRRRLDPVTERRAGAVQLHVGDLVRADPCILIGRPEQPLLCVWIGRGERIPTTVVVDGAASDDAENPIAAGDGSVQRLEHHQAASLSAHEAVRPRVEGEAAAIRRERSERSQLEGGVRPDVEIDPARQRQRRFAREQALAGHVN